MANSTITTREKILKAALKLFSERGYNGATTSEIAKEAGVAEGTIFRYFPTKKDLLLSVANPVVVGSLKSIIADCKEYSPQDFLEAVIHNRLEIISNNIDLVKVLVTESQFHPELKDKFIEEIIYPAAGLMQVYFQEQGQKGILRDIDTEISVRVLVGMVAVFVIWKYAFEGERYVKFSDEAVVSNIVDIFLNGMLKKPGEKVIASDSQEYREQGLEIASCCSNVCFFSADSNRLWQGGLSKKLYGDC